MKSVFNSLLLEMILLMPFALKAEGSKELRAYTYTQTVTTGVPILGNLSNDQVQNTPYFRLFVYARVGEMICLASSNIGITNTTSANGYAIGALTGKIFWTSPNGATGSTSDPQYRINNSTQEDIGPNKFFAGGYKGFEINVTAATQGIWTIDYYISGADNSSGATSYSGFDQKYNIVLKDKLLGTSQDLRKNPIYTFDLQGNIVSSFANVNQTQFECTLPSSGPVLIVKVISDHVVVSKINTMNHQK